MRVEEWWRVLVPEVFRCHPFSVHESHLDRETRDLEVTFQGDLKGGTKRGHETGTRPGNDTGSTKLRKISDFIMKIKVSVTNTTQS